MTYPISGLSSPKALIGDSQSANEDFQPRFDGSMNDFCPFIFNTGKEMEGYNSVQHPPYGIPVLTEIERFGKLSSFDPVFEDLFDNTDRFVGAFNNVVV